MYGGKILLFLSQSVCSDTLLLHLFLKIRLICCSATWPFFSTPQSKHALSYWKQILILILFQKQSLFCMILVLFLPCLTFHRKHILFFFFKRKNQTDSLISGLCAAQVLRAHEVCANALSPVVATEHSWKKISHLTDSFRLYSLSRFW